MDTKSTILVVSLVLCIIYFAWSHSQSQSEHIKTLESTNQTLRIFVPQSTQSTQSTRSTSQSVQIPPNVPPASAVGIRPSDNGRSPFPPRMDDEQFGIGQGIEDVEPRDQFIPAGNLSDPGPDALGNPLPTYA